jgi:diguanylate cyclase (GGDEF)-like protein
MSLRTKLLLVLLLSLLVSLLVFSAGSFWVFNQQLHIKSKSYQQDLSLQLIRSVRAEYDSAATAANSLAKSSVLAEYFAMEQSVRELVLHSAVLDLFASYEMIHPAIHQIQLWNVNYQREAYLTNKNMAGPSDVSRDMLDEVTALQSPAEMYLLNNQQGESYLMVIAPVYKEMRNKKTGRGENVIVGYVVLGSPFELLQRVADLGESETTLFFFVDEYGRLLTKLDNSVVEQLPAFSEVIGLLSDDNTLEFSSDGESYFFRFHQVLPEMWLGSLIDNSAIDMESISFLRSAFMPMMVVTLFAGLLFYWFVSKRLITPIEQLISATRKIAKGDYNLSLAADSADELGELSLAMRFMSEQVSQSSKRIQQLAYYDSLTQLPNRNTLAETLDTLIANGGRDQQKLAVLFIDLDDFKKVNDSLGHAAGDDLLVQVSQRLKDTLRTSDSVYNSAHPCNVDEMVSRLGGDEFNALVNGINSAHDAALIAKRIVKELGKPFSIFNKTIHVGASVGIAIYPDDGVTAEELLKNADLAMYEAKADGKNNYHIYTEEINRQVHERLQLEQDIREAVQKNDFELYFQPKIALDGGEIEGFEALIRWNHQQKGLVSPAYFIPLAEESSLILDIGYWVLQEAAKQISQWRDSCLANGRTLAVNISAKQISQKDFVTQLRTIFGEARAPLELLEIELTETSLFSDEQRVNEHLLALKKLGVQISLDDFGTGYSSLNFLRRFPIDSIKIDRSFIANLTESGESQAIVIAVLQLCNQMHLKVVAEGIEEFEQVSLLKELGCDQGQGYYFAKPMSATDIERFQIGSTIFVD